MTVEVTFRNRQGREETAEFDNEYLALIFVDGLRARQSGDGPRDVEKFNYIASGVSA